MADPRFDRPDEDWRNYGNCLGLDADLFFPERGGESAEAKIVCAACQVRQTCLDYAIDNSIKFGIWGGLAERQRREMRRDREGRVALHERTCEICDRQFLAESNRAKVCGYECRLAYKAAWQRAARQASA